MNVYVIYLSIMAAAFGAPGVAEKSPDFSGVWSVSAIRPAPKDGGATALPPSDVTIRQTQAQLSVSRTYFDNVTTATYALDGSESTNRSGAMTRVTKAHWERNRLVIEGKASQVTSQGYAAWAFKEIYSLDPKGRLLIDSDWVGDDGKATKNVQELVKKR